jgi:exosortase F-associated protein
LLLPSAHFHPYVVFILNKTCRLVVNDLACFLLILALFQDRRYLKLAWWLFLFELLVLLPIYFAVKLTLEGDSEISSPLLSQVHRLIVNPMLMILLMAGFFYQRSRKNT